MRLTIRTGSFGFNQRFFGMFSRCAGNLFGLLRHLEISFGLFQCSLSVSHGRAGAGRVFFGLGQSFAAVFNQTLCRLVTSRQTGHILGLLGHHRFAILQGRCRLTRSRLRCLKAAIVTLPSLRDFTLFPFEPFNRFARVLIQARFAFNIPRQLIDAVF